MSGLGFAIAPRLGPGGRADRRPVVGMAAETGLAMRYPCGRPRSGRTTCAGPTSRMVGLRRCHLCRCGRLAVRPRPSRPERAASAVSRQVVSRQAMLRPAIEPCRIMPLLGRAASPDAVPGRAADPTAAGFPMAAESHWRGALRWRRRCGNPARPVGAGVFPSGPAPEGDYAQFDETRPVDELRNRALRSRPAGFWAEKCPFSLCFGAIRCGIGTGRGLAIDPWRCLGHPLQTICT